MNSHIRLTAIVAVGFLGVAGGTSWAQGTVDFRNGGVSFRTVANRYVYFGAVGPGAGTPPGSADPNRLVGTTYVASLWYVKGASQGAQINQARQVGRTFNFRLATTAEINKGTWVIAAGASPTFTFPDVAIGESATLQVRVWDSARFNSWEAAVAGGQYGGSAPFDYTVPAAGSPSDAYYLDNLRACCPHIPQPAALRIVNAGVIAGQVHFNLTGPPGQSVIVEASTDLLSWLPIWTNSLTPDLNFNDVQSGVASHRFYRARLP